MKFLIAAILPLVLCAVGFASKNEKKNADKDRGPAANATTASYFDGSVAAEYDASNTTWGAMYRYYDKTHKVVCYRLASATTMACVPSSATP